MPLSLRTLAVLFVAGVLFAILRAQSAAEPPPALPESLPTTAPESLSETLPPALPESLPSVPALPSRAREVIDKIIEGELKPEEAGIPILGDVMEEAVGENGSLASQLGKGLFPEDEVEPSSQAEVSRTAAVAEQMLRAARLLEEIGDSSSGRSELIRRMRAEAKKLL